MPSVAANPRSMLPLIYIGVDPGASGGLATVGQTVENCGEGLPMPETERDLWQWFADLNYWLPDRAFAVIEKVGGYIAGNAAPGSAMFNFGKSYGGLRMALIAAGIPFEEATPQAWQKGLGIVKRGKDESKTAWKNKLKQKAQQLFPQVKVTLATADALLIAEFCRRKRQGTL